MKRAQSRRAVRPPRLVRLITKPSGGAPGVVRIAVGKEAQDYFLTRVPSDFGAGFLLEKIGAVAAGEAAAYHVHLDGSRRSCECKGFFRHGHCKHADGLAALVDLGRLPIGGPTT